MVLRLIVGALGLAMHCACLAEEKADINIYTVDVKGKNSVEIVRLTLPDAEPGSRLRASVAIKNRTEEEIAFVSASSSCKCTQVKVPKTTIVPGGAATTEFEFAIPAFASKLREQFTVTANSKGARNAFLFTFDCQLKNVVSLIKSEGMLQYSENDKNQMVRIPVLLSDHRDLTQVTVVSDEALQFSNPRLVKEGENVFAEFAYNTRLLDQKTVIGSIRLLKKGKIVSEQVFTMKFAANVRVLPEFVLFTVGEVPEIQREATVLIKFADVGKGDDDLTIRSIDCSVGKNERLRCALTPMSKGLYRVHLSTPNPILVEKSEEKSEMVRWKIVKNSGESIEIQSAWSLSN